MCCHALSQFLWQPGKSIFHGARVRLLGEARPGFFGMEMVHPKCRIMNQHEPLADTLTPVYPATAGLSSGTIRKLIQRALRTAARGGGKRRIILQKHCQTNVLATSGLPGLRDSVVFLHQPPPDVRQPLLQERTHPAWRRIKFDELLAQQLSMRLHYRRRRSGNAPVLRAKNRLTKMLLESLPFELTKGRRKFFRNQQ